MRPDVTSNAGAGRWLRPRPWIAVVLAALLGASAGAAMEMKDSSGHGGPAGFGHPADAKAATKTVAITMENLKFRPEALRVKAGDIVHFVITNTSGAAHEFTLGDPSFQQAHRQHMAAMAGMAMHHHGASTVSVEAHETKDLTWTFEHPGPVEFDCDIPGHYEAGMRGTIIVE